MFLRRSPRRCELLFLTLWASICCLAAAGPSISPTFALLGHATTFIITDVKYPYIICTTDFPDSKEQAVYANVADRDGQGERAASCVVDAPELPLDVQSVDAHIQTSGAPGPRGNLQDGDRYLMQFIQPPTVLYSDLQYQHSDKAGYSVRVFLQSADGLKKVKDRINAALQLEVDMSVVGQNTAYLSGTVVFSKDSATASFRLPQMLPNGRYPCVLTISGHSVRLTDSNSSNSVEAPQTRAEDLFNSSESARVLPLTQPVETHTFMLSVSYPTVLLTPAAMSARDLALCADDEDDRGCIDAIDEPGTRTPQLWLSLRGQQAHGDVSVLLSLTLGNTSVTEADIVAAVNERDVSSTKDDVVVLPLPSDEGAGVALLWVEWDGSTARARRLMFEPSDQEFPAGGCFVRVFRAIAASVDLGLQSAWVAPSGHAQPAAPPEFSVQGQLVAHRGDNVSFHVLRRGPPSDQESRVLWRLVYLDPASNSELPMGLGGMISPDIGPGKGVGTVQRAGTLRWLPGDDQGDVKVTVPVVWDTVPYAARWMLAVRLSARQNGVVVKNEYAAPLAPPPQAPPAAPPYQQLTDQLNGFTPVVAGGTDLEAAAVHAIVYGVRENACAPSTGRIDGAAREPPVVNGLSTSHTILGLSLRVSSHESRVLSGEKQFVQTAPPFEGPAGVFSAMVPYDMQLAAVAVSSSWGEAVLMRGCGMSEQTAAPQQWNSTAEPGVVHHLWPVQRPDNSSMCTAVVQSCSATAHGIDTCERGSRTDRVRVLWLDDPSLAQIGSVNVTVGEETQQACGKLTGRVQASGCHNGTVASAESVSEHCSVDECRPHAFVNMSLVYHRGDTIKIAVQPMRSGRVEYVAIGQRMFRADATGELGRVGVAFRLFDASDRLSPFVPFVIRERTHDRTVLHVPIMLALADGVTAVPFTLLLDVAVLPSRNPALPVLPVATAPVGRSSGNEDTPPVSVQVVAESGHVSFLTNGVATAEAPIDVSASRLGSRTLMDVSTAAPAHQPWLDDPLNNPQCRACPEGFFSNNMDVLCQRCEPGSCAPYPGMAACSTCPQGSYAPVYGASSCSPCVHGSYAQLPGSTACRLCPFGYTTKSDGAVACDRAVEQTVAIGKEYALAVSFSVRLIGMSFDDVPQRTGVLGSSEDILQFLVSLDSAAAFRVSTADVEVSSMTEFKPRMLRINVTTNIAIDAPKKASEEELERAITLAQLSKDAGIGNLTWDHTTEALGANAVTEDKVETEILEPDPERGISWQAIVMPIIAGIIILGSLMCLKIQRGRDHGLDSVTQTPVMLVAQALGAVRAAMCPSTRRTAHRFGHLSSEVISDLSDNLQVDLRPRETGKHVSSMNSTDAIELNPHSGSETRKRPVSDLENCS